MNKRKYHLDESIFENVNNEEKAYWLGFFMADGAITENKIRLTLKASDYDHLLKWKKFTKWDGKDYYHKHTNAWEVYFRSTKIKNDLAKYTITERKTYTVCFPNNISINLMPHFVRGYFDADGCITKQQRKTVRPNGKTYCYNSGEFNIEGNPQFIKTLQDKIFIKTLGLPKTSINYHHPIIKRVRYGGIDQLAKIFHYLYDDAHIYLERKFDIFADILLHRERLNEQALERVKQQSELHSNMQSVGETQHRLSNDRS